MKVFTDEQFKTICDKLDAILRAVKRTEVETQHSQMINAIQRQQCHCGVTGATTCPIHGRRQ